MGHAYEQDLKDLGGGRGIHLGRLTAALAHHHGDRRAIESPAPTPGLHPGGWRTYREVEHAVARLAAAHRAAGAERGQRMMVVLDNRLDIALHAMALARLGVLPTLVNHRLTLPEVEAVMDSTRSTHLVVDDDVMDRLDEAGFTSDVGRTLTGVLGDGRPSVATWLEEHPTEVVPPTSDHTAEEVALFLTTSGTTGHPKPAALTSRGLLETPGRIHRLPIGRDRWPRANRDLVLAALPIAHVMGFGMVLGMLAGGLPSIALPRFRASEVLDLIEERRPNVFFGVPTMYADLEAAGAADRDLSSIQVFASSADAMPAERARRFQTYGSWLNIAGRRVGDAIFLDGYGMVELSGAGAVRLYPPGPSRFVRLPSVAKVVPGLEVRAVDEDGRGVGRGQVGELQFRGPQVLKGYEGYEQAGPDADGWLSSGDFARVWPGGFFSFAGRRKDRLKIGGFSVFPAEVEHELATYDGIGEVAVVGVADERLGERPVALVVPRSPGAFDVEAFLAWAHDNVAGYRCPRSAHVVDAIPRGHNDKVDRGAATEIGERLEARRDQAPA